MKRFLAIVLLAVLMGGCDAGEPSFADETVFDVKAEWRELPDGSQFARTSVQRASDAQQVAIRCWTRSDGNWNCLKITQSFEMTDEMLVIDAGSINHLPDEVMPWEALSSEDGYGCISAFGLEESISRNGERLTSNNISIERRSWPKEFVVSYLQENGVKGRPYFDCQGIVSEIEAGSLETLGTTSINQAMVAWEK